MTDQTPTNTLTDTEREDLRGCLRQNLGYRAWVIEDTLLNHIERILAAREAHTNTLRDRVTALVEESEKAAEAMRESREMWPTTSQEWSDLNSLSLRLDAEARRYRAALDAAPAPTDNDCHCQPCPGRGNDGHGLTHCAECCMGTGVEAQPDCPTHGYLPFNAPTDNQWCEDCGWVTPEHAAAHDDHHAAPTDNRVHNPTPETP